MHPQSPIVDINSSLNNSNVLLTPLEPLTIRPHKDGLPIETIFAPREIAFKISEPVLIPPSKIII